MQSAQTDLLKGLNQALEQALKDFPERRRELHERVGKAVQRELHSQIGASRLSDSGGRIKRWQVAHVGSGGGYAAVRAMGSAEGASVGRSSPGAITNYLESGHRIPMPRGGKGYRPRIKKAFVNGYHFYSETSQRAESIAIAEAEAWADELAAELEGML